MEESKDETPQVTTPQEPVTIKDPKKVEAGKKLAAISKAAKEKKMRAKIEEEMEAEASKKKITIPIPLLVGIPIVGGYLMYKYFTREGKKRVDVVPEPKKSRSPSPPPRRSPSPPPRRSPSPPPRRSPSPPPKKKFESFD